MSSLIKQVFEDVCGALAIDMGLALRLSRYQMGFVNKNRDHAEFFGGNLTGVHVVRFLDSDKNRWFDEIIDADEEELRERLHVIPALSGANGVFQVSGDPMNLSVVWLLHRLHNETSLKPEVRKEAMINALLIVQFKFLTSRLFRHFKYPADRAVAEATYAQLTNKFSIKIYGSWLAVLRARAEDVVSNTSIHFQAIAKMDNDDGVVRMLNDVQGRIREMLKNIYGVFLKTHATGTKITATSSVIEHDGVQVLKDQTRGLQTYTRYLKSVVGDRNSFVRDELLRVVENLMPSAPPKHLEATLEFLSSAHLQTKPVDVGRLLEMVMIHSFAYLASNRAQVRASVDLAGLLSRLRGVYTSSRSTDPELLALRVEMEKAVRQAVTTKTDAVIASVRTAALLYVVARTYTMRHYTTL